MTLLISMGLATCLRHSWFPHEIPYKKEITYYSCKNKINPVIVASVVATESSFNRYALVYERNVHDYSIGLMQLRSATARLLGYKGPFNGLYSARTNLMYGIKYLKTRILQYPSNYDGIEAYNTGKPKWSDHCRCYLTTSGKRNYYVRKVINNLKRITGNKYGRKYKYSWRSHLPVTKTVEFAELRHSGQ